MIADGLLPEEDHAGQKGSKLLDHPHSVVQVIDVRVQALPGAATYLEVHLVEFMDVLIMDRRLELLVRGEVLEVVPGEADSKVCDVANLLHFYLTALIVKVVLPRREDFLQRGVVPVAIVVGTSGIEPRNLALVKLEDSVVVPFTDVGPIILEPLQAVTLQSMVHLQGIRFVQMVSVKPEVSAAIKVGVKPIGDARTQIDPRNAAEAQVLKGFDGGALP
mmetsp:Transcript_26061/g.49210  ORF Transcript_26061/g.49210 Transcript_26061/m.49210 type:complete len:219 (+) Transcript_26061:3617-4273(+)